MKLRCKLNKVIQSGPRYNNETDEEMTINLSLTVGKEYEGQILRGKLTSPGDYNNYGEYMQICFACFNDNGEFRTYNLERLFGPVEEVNR